MFVPKPSLIGALVLGGAVLLTSQPVEAQRGGRGPTASPAAQYRQNIMRGFNAFNGMIRAITREQAGDPSHVQGLAEGWDRLAATLTEAFPAGSAGEGSRALPAIWEQPEEFAQKIADLRAALQGLAAAAQSGDAAAVSEAAGAVTPTCGGCHQPFRAPAGDGDG